MAVLARQWGPWLLALFAAVQLASAPDAGGAKPTPRTVVGNAATPEITRYIGIARQSTGRVIPRVRVFASRRYVYAAAEAGRALIWVGPEFATLTPMLQCQVIAHEYRHLLGIGHQDTDPADIMFSRPGDLIAWGEGWTRPGAAPGCESF